MDVFAMQRRKIRLLRGSVIWVAVLFVGLVCAFGALVYSVALNPDWEKKLVLYLGDELESNTGAEVQFSLKEVSDLDERQQAFVEKSRVTEGSDFEAQLQTVGRLVDVRKLTRVNFMYLPAQHGILARFYQPRLIPDMFSKTGSVIFDPFDTATGFNVYLRLDRLKLENLNWWSGKPSEIHRSGNGFYQLMRLWGYRGSFDEQKTRFQLQREVYETPVVWLGFGILVVAVVFAGVGRLVGKVMELDKEFHKLVAVQAEAYGVDFEGYGVSVFLREDLGRLFDHARREMRNNSRGYRRKPQPQFVMTANRAVSKTPEQLKRERVDSLLNVLQTHLLAAADPDVQTLVLEAQETTDLDKKIRRLQRAVALLKEQQDEEVANSPDHQPVPQTGNGRDSITITLEDEINRLFPKLDFLPEELDPETVRAILIVLLQPGYHQSRIETNWLPANFLKDGVVRFFRLHKRAFAPRKLIKAIRVLKSNGVLKFAKTQNWHDGSYCLTGKSDNVSSLWARQLVRAYLGFDKEFKKAHRGQTH